MINILIILILISVFPDAEFAKSENNDDFTVVYYEAREQDIDNDGLIDQLRVVFSVNTTKTQTPVNAMLVTSFDDYPNQYEIFQWDNFTLTNEKSLSRSIFVDAWKEGKYTVTLAFKDPNTNQVLSEFLLGNFNLMVGLEKPFIDISVMADTNGNSVSDNFNTGSNCKITRSVLDKIGHRYDKTGEVQFIGAPWISPTISPGNDEPNSDQIDCSDWPAGKYSLKLIYHNSLGYSLEKWINFSILNQPAPAFNLNLTGQNMEIGSLCFITVEPTDGTDFSENEIKWTTIPDHNISDELEVDCKMWMPGIHRIIVNVTNSEGISATNGINLVRMPPLEDNMTDWGNESVVSSWPLRSGGEIKTEFTGYIATGIGMTLLLLISVIILRKFDDNIGDEFKESKISIDSEGLPTHTDEDGHLWRQHPDGQIDWWDETVKMWIPFQQY
tara:strand:- start:4706 stop:6031 length:1326 start_codon:yes stop_codon:yes gene_type:complete